MYIEYVILHRDMLLSEEFMYEPVWCAYELKEVGDNIAFGEFTIAQYSEDAQVYVEITFSDSEKEKIYRYLAE